MADASSKSDRILIVDFGSQVTQLIARRVREAGVYCEIHPFQAVDKADLGKFDPRAIILSGGPASVIEGEAPSANPAIFESKVPVLGICYGEQTMAHQLGGQVESGHHREFGRAVLDVKADSALFRDVWKPGERHQVWMSHGDRVTKLPPGFSVIATSENAPFAAIADEARRYYAVQFHPEVMHTPDGAKLLRNFALNIAGCSGGWTMAAFKERAIAQVRAQVGKGKVICGLSGGVDSSVVAVLLHEAIGDQLQCVFVDHGLLRKDEGEQVVRLLGVGDLEIGKAGDPERVPPDDLHAREEPAHVRADDRLERHELVLAPRDRHPARQRLRHFHAREVVEPALGVAQLDRQREREVRDVRDRVPWIDRERRQDGIHLRVEEGVERPALLRRQLSDGHEPHAARRQLREDVVVEAGARLFHQVPYPEVDPVKLLARGHPVVKRVLHVGGHLAPQARHADHVELVEVRREDREELQPLEQRDARILRLRQHPGIELQPGELAVEQQRGAEVGGGHGEDGGPLRRAHRHALRATPPNDA